MEPYPHRKEMDWISNIWLAVVHFGACFAFSLASPSAVAVAGVLYFLTGCLGITFCFHRMIAHRSFRAHPVVEAVGLLCGTLALQGTLREWVGDHRLHHAGSDTERDPHNARRGFWYSHMTWLFLDHRSSQGRLLTRLTRDLDTPLRRFFSRHDVMIGAQILLGLVLLSVGGWSWMVWGICVRLVLVYHTTWLVNSATHRWGYRTFASPDLSRNNWWVALLTWGEGWHNNHHRFPSVAPARYRWWEIDVTFAIIWLLERVGLVTEVRRYPAVLAEDGAARSRVSSQVTAPRARPLPGRQAVGSSG